MNLDYRFGRRLRAAPWLVLSVMLASLAGCATTPKFSSSTSSVGVQLDKIYVYSFLDVRQNVLGQHFLEDLKVELDQKFASHGVVTEQLWFRDSPVFSEFAAAGLTSVMVPIGRVIVGNRPTEVHFGARYRLVAFPLETTAAGSWNFYDFRWDLIDVTTGMKVWTTTSHAGKLNFAGPDEYPQKRADMIVGGLIGEMKKAGFLRS
jgi:hypothetical protein